MSWPSHFCTSFLGIDSLLQFSLLLPNLACLLFHVDCQVLLYFGFLTWIVLCAKFVPGPSFLGQPLAGGKARVMYKLNGFRIAVVTWVSFYVSAFVLELFPATIIYDNMAPLSSTVLLFVLGFSTYLYVTGKINGGDAPVHGHVSQNPVMRFIDEFWHGVELNPRIFGLDVKFTALKVSLIGWVVMNMSFAAAQMKLTGGTMSDGMIFYQIFAFVYSADYYWNESAMLSTWDIIAEHFGLMLVFGDFWWMWFAFSVQPWYLMTPEAIARKISPFWQIVLVIFFCIGYWIFRGANSQKNDFKNDPNVLIWGKKPETIGGRILISGWWGILRKANYLGDWIIALSLAFPCGFSHLFAFFYPIYLISLDTHRAIRDDHKCSAKYKEIWVEYKKRVPYAVIPGII